MTRFPNPAKVPANATVPSWMARASAPSEAAISMPFGGRAAAEPARDRPVDRPVEGAAERPERQLGRLGGRRAGRQIAQRRLQLLLGGLQLARELRVQVALLVDVADEVGLAPARRAARRPAPSRPPREAWRAPRCASSSVLRVVFSSASVCACVAMRSRSSLASAATVRVAWPRRRRSGVESSRRR